MESPILNTETQMKKILAVNDRGYTLAAVLTLLAIMAIFLALAVPLWSRVKQRDNEEELIFRGNQYIKAIARYHAKFGSYPPDIKTLVELKYIRQEYLDPMTKSGKWKVLHPDALTQTGQAGTINTPGRNNNNNLVNDDKNRNTNSGSSFGNDRDDRDDNGNDNKDGLSSDDDENKDEEPEVESVGPVVGVVSRSKKASMKILNGQTYYNKWIFVYALQQQQPQQRPPQPPPGGTPNTGPNTRPPGSGGPRPPTPNPNPNPTPNPNPQDSGDDDDDGGGN